MILILSGEPGTGKTYHSMGWEEPILFLDTENPRAEKTRKKWYLEKEVKVVPLLIRNPRRDYYESYLELKKIIDGILEKPVSFSTLVIDGISDVRSKYAKAKWFRDHPKRQNPMPEEWTEINKTTNDLLEPLIDLANRQNIHLVWTAQFCDEYGGCEKMIDGKLRTVSEKIGREPNYETWQAYGVDTLIQLSYVGKKYIVDCTKSIIGCWREDITNQRLYDVLLEKGV